MEWRLAILLISGFLMECVSVRLFHFVNMKKTWTEAQRYCREKYSDLATIDNMEDMQMIRNSGKDYNGKAWIGLQQTTDSSWKWSLADEDFYGPGETDFTAWRQGKPSNDREKKCTAVNDNKWNNFNCETKFPFVCYDGSNSYVLVNERKTWRGAQSYCRENHTDLVSVRNEKENQQIKKKVGSEEAWIGLFREDWIWSDQRNSSFRYWKPKVPDNRGTDNCAVTWLTDKGKGKWGDRTCDEQNPFFCHSDKLQLVSEKLSWTEALHYCTERGMDLVSIFSEETQRWVTEVAKDASTAHVWLGLHFLCPLDIWFWISGETVCYTNWAKGNCTGGEVCGGAERAGAVQSGGEHKWVSLPESTKLNFICATD